MAAVLTGNTATKVISNVAVLKIQLIDDERLFYQFLDVADQKAYEIVEAEITVAPNESSEETEFCFYLDSDKEKDTPYFLSEFIRDGYPALR